MKTTKWISNSVVNWYNNKKTLFERVRFGYSSYKLNKITHFNKLNLKKPQKSDQDHKNYMKLFTNKNKLLSNIKDK